MQPVVARVRRRLGRLPAPLGQEVAVLQAEDLDFEGSAALDHLPLAVGAEAPEGEIAARAGALSPVSGGGRTGQDLEREKGKNETREGQDTH